MRPAKRQAYLIILGAIALALAVVVYVRHKGGLDHEIFATIAIIGALAILIVSLPEDKE